MRVHNGYRRTQNTLLFIRQDPADGGGGVAGSWRSAKLIYAAVTEFLTKRTQPKSKKTESDNPLWGYHAAMETLVGVAKGRIRSEMRLEAARTLLEHCSVPPTVSWDYEDDES